MRVKELIEFLKNEHPDEFVYIQQHDDIKCFLLKEAQFSDTLGHEDDEGLMGIILTSNSTE